MPGNYFKPQLFRNPLLTGFNESGDVRKALLIWEFHDRLLHSRRKNGFVMRENSGPARLLSKRLADSLNCCRRI
jgi:hypothetical protein